METKPGVAYNRRRWGWSRQEVSIRQNFILSAIQLLQWTLEFVGSRRDKILIAVQRKKERIMKKAATLAANLMLMCVSATRGDTWHVATNSISDGPGTAWSNAYNTIQSAVDAASDGDTVLVSNGVYDTGGAVTPEYSCSNRVCLMNNITIESLNGPDHTVIVGAAASGGGNGDDAVRGVYMSAGLLSGFTVTNGHTITFGSYVHDRSGGGINMHAGGMATNCFLAGNSADFGGGGSLDGTLNNCTLSGNTAEHGGASQYGTLNHCVITGNLATGHANSAGGASHHATLNNCLLSGNSASWAGGGASYCNLNNCLLTGNSADYGGGTHFGTLNNCTLSGNSAAIYGGGNYYGTLNNCIVSGNTAASGGDDTQGGTFSHSCFTPLRPGVGNTTNDPQFVDAAAGNYRLQPGSPCIDAGDNANASGQHDLDGIPRIVNTVDMGPYERIHSPDNYDGDLFSNAEEYIADTDATDANDYFRISGINSNTVYFDSSSSRLYTLLWKTNLLVDAWTNIPGTPTRPGVGGPDSIRPTNGFSAAFYKLIVELP